MVVDWYLQNYYFVMYECWKEGLRLKKRFSLT